MPGPLRPGRKGEIVVVTISGRARNVDFDHALEIAEYYKDEGWFLPEQTSPSTHGLIWSHTRGTKANERRNNTNSCR